MPSSSLDVGKCSNPATKQFCNMMKIISYSTVVVEHEKNQTESPSKVLVILRQYNNQ